MDDEAKHFLREILEEHSEKMESYLNIGREKLASLEERSIHQAGSIEVLNRLVIKGNGEKGLIVRSDWQERDIESLQARADKFEEWKSASQKREFWLKLISTILGAITAGILLWLSLTK